MKEKRLNTFVLTLVSIMLLMYLFISTQLIYFVDLNRKVKVFLYMFLIIPFAQMAWLPLVYWWLDEKDMKPRHKWMSKVSYFWMGFLSIVLFFIVLRATILMPIWYFAKFPYELFGWEYSLFTILGAVFLYFYGFIKATGIPKIENIKIPIRNVNDKSKIVRIAQISDLHISDQSSKKFIELVVNEVNKLNPEFIVLTGDIGDGEPAHLKDKIDILKILKPRYKTFYIPGNHECYWGVKEWIHAIKEVGATPLINKHEIFDFDGFKIAIAGVPDFWNERFEASEKSDPVKAIANCPSDVQFKILLAHQPQSYKQALVAGFDMQLSGHTHAGQYLPWSLIIGLFHKFSRGLYKHQNMWVYVNRGTGHWGPALRILASPEITHIHIA